MRIILADKDANRQSDIFYEFLSDRFEGVEVIICEDFNDVELLNGDILILSFDLTKEELFDKTISVLNSLRDKKSLKIIGILDLPRCRDVDIDRLKLYLDEIISKPYGIGELLTSIEKVIGRT